MPAPAQLAPMALGPRVECSIHSLATISIKQLRE
jgi:hypothetical protein